MILYSEYSPDPKIYLKLMRGYREPELVPVL